MAKLKAIVFDLDDTLYPERSYALSGFAAVARWAERELGVPYAEGRRELLQLFETGVRGDTFNRWLAQRKLPDDHRVSQMVDQYRDHMPEIEPFPDALPVLEQLRHEYQLGLITQGHRPGQQRKLEALGLTEYFRPTIILGEDQRQDWKPSPRAFEPLLAELALEGPQAAYIGDNPLKDFIGARQLGMPTVHVRRPGGEHSEKQPPTPQHAADLVVFDLASVPDALERLN